MTMVATYYGAQTQRWLDLSQAPTTLEDICLRVAEGESIAQLASAWAVPRSRILAWLMDDETRYATYQRALEMDAHRLVSETVAIADAAEPETVGVAKVQIDTRFKVAGFHARKVYGEAGGKGGTTVQVLVQRDTAAVQQIEQHQES